MGFEVEKTYTVYALIDPKSDEVKYVGLTSMGMRARLNAHVVDSVRRSTPVNLWIKSLTQAPRYEILEEGSCVGVTEEKAWIKLYREMGVELLNSNDGGPGPGKEPFGEIQKLAWAKKRETTHCPKNHEYSDENTYMNAKGQRSCKICRREASIRFNEKRLRSQGA